MVAAAELNAHPYSSDWPDPAFPSSESRADMAMRVYAAMSQRHRVSWSTGFNQFEPAERREIIRCASCLTISRLTS